MTELYEKRMIAGIVVDFEAIPSQYKQKIRDLDNDNFKLQLQGQSDSFHDSTVLELLQMAIAYKSQYPKFAKMIDIMTQHLERITRDNETLTRLYNLKSKELPYELTLDHIEKKTITINHNTNKLDTKLQKAIARYDYLSELTSQRTPRKILKKFTDNPKKFNWISPVFDPDYYQLLIVFIIAHDKLNKDGFSCFATLLDKIKKTTSRNTGLRIVLDRRSKRW